MRSLHLALGSSKLALELFPLRLSVQGALVASYPWDGNGGAK